MDFGCKICAVATLHVTLHDTNEASPKSFVITGSQPRSHEAYFRHQIASMML